MQVITYDVVDPVGFHARPVSRLVQEANLFVSDIYINYKESSANLKSVFSILALTIPVHAQIKITINGEDEIIAKNHIEKVLSAL
ncbi:HPr family phosphocarrier protein [Fusibacter bizertensis]|uniref:HPr family phosphocarrier protein n=1 Tax=Fusibacter bizertensis TaxID=1488331 RepID=A0ABT6N810_9FIRM|nr:HPr family phosphocarrier protein [Fusibacter bizertensis]MDH8676542.1 HPr family phosphocarrier protein [Fusibacter bizertensis]